MKTVYFDCQMGAAGDMLSAALLDLLPDREEAVRELNAIGVPGVTFRLERTSKCAIAATRLEVLVNGEIECACHSEDGHGHHHHHHHHAHRTLDDVLHLIGNLRLADGVREKVAAAYRMLAEAESRAHGRSVAEIHFHEIGTMDAIADIAAFCYLMARLAPDEVVASPIHVGCGTVDCAHGTVPVPAPATAFLLEGVPSYSDGEVTGELCTPTGAVLVKLFAGSFGPQPLVSAQAIGYGAGKKDFPQANVVRAILGERVAPAMREEGICELDFNVDDMTGEELAYAAERLAAAGAKDVSIAQVVMKKGRPGQLVIVMCMKEDEPAVVEAIFKHTSTLGVRQKICRRYVLERSIEQMKLPDGAAIRRKVASGYGVKRWKWEADDLAAEATRRGVSLAEIRAIAEKSN